MVLLWSLVVILLWGANGFLTKWAAERIGMQVLMWRVLLQTAIGFSFLGATGALGQLQRDRYGLLVALLAGVVGSFGTLGYYFLLNRYQASRVVPLSSLYPLVTVALSVAFLREKLTVPQWVGAFLAVGALMLLGYGGD
jgi:transporter family protein